MSEKPSQDFSNHRSIDKLFGVQLLVLLAAVVLAFISFFKFNTPAGWCILASAVLLHTLIATTILVKIRLYSVKVQDRIIRLEMEIRLGRVLSGDLAEKAQHLGLQQLIGLRFASDAELPALIKQVLSDDIQKADAIKKLVKDWQPDHHRV
jgi:hypothetical protein